MERSTQGVPDRARRVRDQWLALRCQAGEPAAFADLVAEFERPLLYYATKLLGNPERALDALQEVWIAAVKGIRRLQSPQSLRPWLYRLTHAAAVGQIRTDEARRLAETRHIEVQPGDEDEAEFDPTDAAAIHEAMDRLSIEHREALVLYFLNDLSVAEIAQVIGCAEGTVKSRLHYARLAMKQTLVRGGYE